MDARTPYETLFHSVADAFYDGLYIVTPRRRIAYWNKSAERITGYKSEEVIGKHCQNDILCHISKSGTPLCHFGCPLLASIHDQKRREAEVLLRHKAGHRVSVLVRVHPLMHNGAVVGAVEMFSIAAPTAYEDGLVRALAKSASHDDLTRIPNRNYLRAFISHKLLERKQFGSEFCVIFGDLDHFRDLNNTYGHDAGDKALIAASESVRASVQSGDVWGRWGGEEFVGVFAVRDDDDVKDRAERVRTCISETQVVHDDARISMTMSIGVTAARPTDTVDDIVQRADKLMYESKSAGRDRVTMG